MQWNLKAVLVLLLNFNLHNPDLKSIFRITNLICFRDIWKTYLSSSENNFFNRECLKHCLFSCRLFWKQLTSLNLQLTCVGKYPSAEMLYIWTVQLLSLNFKVYIRYIVFLLISFCFFICWQLGWIKSLRISFTSCFQTEGRVKSLRTGELKNV